MIHDIDFELEKQYDLPHLKLYKLFSPDSLSLPADALSPLQHAAALSASSWLHPRGAVWVLLMDRPRVRNAVDRSLALSLALALEAFDRSPSARVAVLSSTSCHFCAGADLASLGAPDRALLLAPPSSPALLGRGPLGPSRMALRKPLLCAVDGAAVAGGLELSLLGDLRVCTRAAYFGVFCRRLGVPLVDGGTVRLPRVVGRGRALDMVLTGRAVGAEEALQMGLANRLVDGAAQLLPEALGLAAEIARFPQQCMLADRESLYHAEGRSEAEGICFEFQSVLKAGDLLERVKAFTERGEGRSGKKILSSL